MSFGGKHECARLKEELVSVRAQLLKLREERDTLAKFLEQAWNRYDIIYDLYLDELLRDKT